MARLDWILPSRKTTRKAGKMDAPSTTPHDAVFKQFLMHAETARDFLEIHLPVELRELCDLNTLHLESGSFIEESLKGHSTDVLYSVQMQGNPGYLHVVIEHQSKPDKKMAFRMMRYSIAAMHRHLEADHDKLPLVVPILFYQARPHLIRSQCAGLIYFTRRSWHDASITVLSRWWISPSHRMTKSCNIGGLRFSNYCKNIFASAT